VTKGNAKAQMQ